MNWFTKRTTTGMSDKQLRQRVEKLDDMCEHVEADPTKLAVISSENDSFGSESYGMCQACNKGMQEAEDSIEVACFDCNQRFTKGSMIEWKAFDFDPSQGDLPLLICPGCQSQAKHKHRAIKDAQAASPGVDDIDEEPEWSEEDERVTAMMIEDCDYFSFGDTSCDCYHCTN